MKYSRENLERMTKPELRDIAKELSIKNRWDMTKPQLVSAICEANEGPTTDSTIDYVKRAAVGSIVAFKVKLGGKERVLSAMIMLKAIENGVVKVKTRNGSTYTISIDDIIWVKTGQRWPRWVLLMLKGDDKGAEVHVN